MKLKKKIVFGVIVAILILAIAGVAIYYFSVILPKKREEEKWKKIFAEHYANRVKAFEQENLQYEDFEVDVAFLGDSLTEGYDIKNFYSNFEVVNRGIGGDTTFGLEKRLKVSAYDLKPKVVVMLIGANNFDTMFDNYEDILIGFKENLPQTKIVLLSLTSMGKDWGKNNQLAAFNNYKIKKLAEKYEFEFVDLYSPLLNLEDNEIYDEYTTDGGHLTTEGYEIVTAQVMPVLNNLLN